MSKPRLLIPLTIQFSIRYVIRTGLLKLLSDFVDPIIVLGWKDDDLLAEFKQGGIEVHQLPEIKQGREYHQLRVLISLYHFDHLGSCSTEIDRRRNHVINGFRSSLYKEFKTFVMRWEIGIKGGMDDLCARERQVLGDSTNIEEYRHLINEIKPDALFCLTPFLMEEEFLVRAAKEAGIKISTAILSFDNITTRGWIPILFDAYFLWNQYNVNELHRIYPQTVNKTTKIVGAPQFDFYFDPNYIWSEAQWRKTLNLPHESPVILFGAGPETIAPPEPYWLEQLDQSIENGEIQGMPVILLRIHPVDSGKRWKNLLLRAKNVVVDEAWPSGKTQIGKTNITRWDIEKLASTLKYSEVHINTSSTMTIDGAIFDRPQIGPAYDDRLGRRYDLVMKELYQREHYLPITNSGGLKVVHSREEMITAVNLAFSNPAEMAIGRARMIDEICTHGDGKSTLRVAEVIRSFVVSEQVMI